MFSVLTEGCHVGYSREFVGTVYCTYGQSNTTIGRCQGYLSERCDLLSPDPSLFVCLELLIGTILGNPTPEVVEKCVPVGS